MVLAQLLGLGLAERHDPVAAALGVVHHPEQDEQDDAQRDQVDQHRDQERVLAHRGVERRLVRRRLQRLDDRATGLRGVLGEDLRAAVERLVQREPEPLLTVLDQSALDVARIDLGECHRGVDLRVTPGVVEQHAEAEIDQDRGQDPDQRVAENALAVHAAAAVTAFTLPGRIFFPKHSTVGPASRTKPWPARIAVARPVCVPAPGATDCGVERSTI